MQELIKGVHHFQNIGFQERESLFARLKEGQEPEAFLITCADSRIVPNLITNSEPGQLFIVRNVGNIVPCHGTGNHAELAAVEYAVMELGIEDLIVCGHTGCGAMTALLNNPPLDAPSRTPAVTHWLQYAESTRQIVREHYRHLKGQALINAAAEENVLVQLEHLRTLPVVAARVSSGKVRLHGWMYKIDTGEVFFYESQVGQFVKFGAAAADGGDRLHASRIQR